MKGVALFDRLHRKADGAAIAMAGGLAIDRRADGKGACGAGVKKPVLVGKTGPQAQRAQERVVKLLRTRQIAHTQHDMTEHGFVSFEARFGRFEIWG